MSIRQIILGLIFLFAPCFVITSTLAQYNTNDPAVFMQGNARSCQGCDLSGANLSNQSRVNAQLRQTNLTEADLSSSNFTGAYFTCSNLSNANLAKANFSYANFVDANLSGADLREANLSRVDFSGAILDATTNLTGANLDGAKLWDAKTLYKPGIDLSRIPRNENLERQRVRCQNQ